jgi:hypothetical protein
MTRSGRGDMPVSLRTAGCPGVHLASLKNLVQNPCTLVNNGDTGFVRSLRYELRCRSGNETSGRKGDGTWNTDFWQVKCIPARL